MPESLHDKVVLVIGASSGIGRETAILFANAGARVMAAARRQDRLNQLKQQYPTIAVHAADANDPAAMQALVQATEAEVGPIEVLVYATGTNTPDRALTRLTPVIWNELIQTNLNGAYYATSAVLPGMRERRRGDLFYVSSISG